MSETTIHLNSSQCGLRVKSTINGITQNFINELFILLPEIIGPLTEDSSISLMELIYIPSKNRQQLISSHHSKFAYLSSTQAVTVCCNLAQKSRFNNVKLPLLSTVILSAGALSEQHFPYFNLVSCNDRKIDLIRIFFINPNNKIVIFDPNDYIACTLQITQ